MFKMVSSISFIAVVAVLLLHYLVFRLGRRVADSDTATIHRYSVFERLVHLGAILAFCTAALTGFGSAIMFAAPPMGWLKLFHIAAGGTLAGCVALMALLWAMDATFTTIDWQWVKVLGGHFSRKHFPPAERFDAGQKVFFWLTVGLGLATLAS